MKRSSGFTLLEMLVALALLGLIGVVLLQTLRTGIHSAHRAELTSDRIDEMLVASRLLRSRLEALNVHSPSAIPSERVYPVEGESQEMNFSAAAMLGDPLGGVARYRLFRRGEHLLLSWRIDRDGLPDRLAGDKWREDVIASNISELRIRYLEPQASGRNRWVDRWYRRTEAPKLIEIRVADQRGMRWPDIRIAVRSDTPVNCAFDPVSRACRSL